MRRGYSPPSIAIVFGTALAVLAIGCTDRSPTETQTDSLGTAANEEFGARVLVSAPFSQHGATSGSSDKIAASDPVRSGDTDDDVVYVSLPPRSTSGDSAIISNLSAREQFIVALIDGGFDPVALPASVGDELAIELRSHSRAIAIARTTVPRRRPPTVVRTDPPKGKTDVPLNTRITIVFNEPVDPSSVSASIQLLQGSSVVAGAVLLSPSRIVAELVLDAPLTGVTNYELVITTGLRNSNGEPLDAELRVPFTTGAQPAEPQKSEVASLSVSVLPGSIAIGQSLAYAVNARSASGADVTDYTGIVHFSSSDPLAQLPPDYTFVAADRGTHIVTTTFESAGNQTLTITDARRSSIRGGATVDVVTVNGFAAINAGVASGCGLTASGNAYCWGANDLGRLGDGTTQDHVAPVAVSGGQRFSVLRTASLQICGLATDGAAYCWGSNLFGALGSGKTSATQMCFSADWAEEGVGSQPCSPSPTPVSGGLRFVALSSGLTTSTCGLTPDGSAYCWGYNRDYELGSGTPTPCYSSADSAAFIPVSPNQPCSTVPVPVSGALHFAAISSGGYHTCGLTTGAEAYCWGYNQYGELGDGGTTNHQVPVRVSSAPRFIAINTGSYHSCGLTIDGLAYCWGLNSLGQLGSGTTMDSSVPVLVSGGLRFTTVTTGSWHSCGLTRTGEAYCWGGNGGALGDGTAANSDVPVLVSGGLRFLSLSAGGQNTCGVTVDGTYCWGANDYGQFGDGTTTSSSIPVKAAIRP
jgi:alpha-tubulin suppressor-like RCC1 family protein